LGIFDERIGVVVDEIPSADIVDVPVAVIVSAIGIDLENILRIEEAIAVGVAAVGPL